MTYVLCKVTRSDEPTENDQANSSSSLFWFSDELQLVIIHCEFIATSDSFHI